MPKSRVELCDDIGEVITSITSGETDVSDLKTKHIRENLARYEELFGVSEEAFEQPTTTRKELWSYYLYYNGR